MAFTPVSGSAGRLGVLPIAASLSVPMPTFSGSPVPIAGITSWKLDLKRDQGKVLHFESTATGTGVLMEEQIQGGVGSWTVSIEGEYDSASATLTDTNFSLGAAVYFNLIFSKYANFGYKNCQGVVASIGPGSNVRNSPSSFTATIEGHGTVPTPS